MLNYKKIISIAFALFLTYTSIAQSVSGADTVKENDFMRSEGKIYVVMLVVITILAGLILYIFRLDLKLKKLEKGEN